MMKKNIIIALFIFTFLTFSSSLWAQNVNDETLYKRNPFLPQLPVPEPKTETKTEPPVNPIPLTDNNKKAPFHDERFDPKPEISAKPVTLPPLAITGWVWNTPRPQAIINGEVLDVGDLVSDAKIVSINKEKIEFSYQGTIISKKP